MAAADRILPLVVAERDAKKVKAITDRELRVALEEVNAFCAQNRAGAARGA